MHVKIFKNGKRKAASVTINEKINEDKIQYITTYRFYVCVPKSSTAESLSRQQ
jgi:hypothetical protein